jgi:hypothetical protein
VTGENCTVKSFMMYISCHLVVLGCSNKVDGMGGPYGSMGKEGNICRVLVGKPEGKQLLERSRHRLDGNIKMVCNEIGRGEQELDSCGSG